MSAHSDPVIHMRSGQAHSSAACDSRAVPHPDHVSAAAEDTWFQTTIVNLSDWGAQFVPTGLQPGAEIEIILSPPIPVGSMGTGKHPYATRVPCVPLPPIESQGPAASGLNPVVDQSGGYTRTLRSSRTGHRCRSCRDRIARRGCDRDHGGTRTAARQISAGAAAAVDGSADRSGRPCGRSYAAGVSTEVTANPIARKDTHSPHAVFYAGRRHLSFVLDLLRCSSRRQLDC